MRVFDGKIAVHAVPEVSKIQFNPDIFEALQLRFSYKIKIIVKDLCDSATFRLLDHDARLLVGYSVHELFEMAPNCSSAFACSEIVDSLVNRMFLFKVAVKVDAIHPDSTTYSIRRLREVKDNMFQLILSENSARKSTNSMVAGSPSVSSKYMKFEKGQSSGMKRKFNP
ncbi:hypothetical protein RIF29_15279 [Crotalaria pallida]|uniref:Uncharacterized protein n=1 Tax=Crotalaria pallida TaxID=3830 RepID=A0AAN9FD95_CROPI